jgi:integrase
MKQPKSSMVYFRQRIPADVKSRAVGTTLYIEVGNDTSAIKITPATEGIRVSLQTNDPQVVKLRAAKVQAYLEGVWQALRIDDTLSLTHRQAVALAREIYEGFGKAESYHKSVVHLDFQTKQSVAPWEDDGEPERMEVTKFLNDDYAGELNKLINRKLIEKHLGKIDDGSRRMIAEAFKDAVRDAFKLLDRQTIDSDYSPDPVAAKYPKWEAPVKAVRFSELLEGWWAEAKAAGMAIGTYENYKAAFRTLKEFLGHDDASRVTAASMVDFKNWRLSKGIKPSSIGVNKTAFGAVFGWAVANSKINSDPSTALMIIKPRKKAVTREKSFEMEEAVAILKHALTSPDQGKRKKSLMAVTRWVPWLCAYTGARVGEMLQLRKQDVHEVRGTWVITITPEAGTVKTKEMRHVVIHRHLIESGFLQFVERSEGPYLFLPPTNDFRAAVRTAKTALRTFVREVVPDLDVQPNHAWRHAFKTRGREVGIADSVLDAICGHAPANVGASYGHVSLPTQVDAMERFPRYL